LEGVGELGLQVEWSRRTRVYRLEGVGELGFTGWEE